MRGMITDKIREKSIELLGYEINKLELRLISYVDYVMKNEQYIEVFRINNPEMNILAKWVRLGFVVDGITKKGRPNKSELKKMVISKQFYDFMQEILWLGYVVHENFRR
jgi:hypothetical protein